MRPGTRSEGSEPSGGEVVPVGMLMATEAGRALRAEAAAETSGVGSAAGRVTPTAMAVGVLSWGGRRGRGSAWVRKGRAKVVMRVVKRVGSCMVLVDDR